MYICNCHTFSTGRNFSLTFPTVEKAVKFSMFMNTENSDTKVVTIEKVIHF